MPVADYSSPPRLALPGRIFLVAGFIALVISGFTLPLPPSYGLDPSWRMVLGRLFSEGRQFGTEVVFTYGPLGWTMGNTYAGGAWWGALLGWHLFLALVMASLVCAQASRLPPLRRLLFVAFFVLFGLRHEDALQQAAIALLGLELIRGAGERWRAGSLVWLALLAVFSLVKFTNLLLAFALVAIAGAAGWRQRGRAALRAPAWFLGLFLAGWMLCAQNPANLPEYFLHSWEISRGYQDAMGMSCPSRQLYAGTGVAALLVATLVVNVLASTDRPRALALAFATASYLFLNWKHGFIRADGHQAAYYWAALTMVFGAPLFLDDTARWRWLRHALLAAAGLLAWFGAELLMPGLARTALAAFQEKARKNLSFVLHPGATRAEYDTRLAAEKAAVDLPFIRAIVRDRGVDLLGYNQAVALFNGFHYTPRPVFQSYSAYTPRLARLNRDYFASAQAPDFLLVKIESIDGRLAAMDDSLVLRLLPHRYTYLFTERGYALWQRRDGILPADDALPAPVRRVTAAIGETVGLGALSPQNLWAEITYQPSLLGRLRRFFFKPPRVHLKVNTQDGASFTYLLPQPVGATGFILNPPIHELGGYLQIAGPRVTSLAIEAAPQDRDCLQDGVTISLYPLPATPLPPMLPLGSSALPLTFMHGEARYGSDLSAIDGHLDYFVHAPATLAYRAAAGASALSGNFGFRQGAYAPDNPAATDGAGFIIRWRRADGTTQVLFERLLRPREEPADRERQSFRVALPGRDGGELEFVTDPGPHGQASSDWAYWSDLTLENSP